MGLVEEEKVWMNVRNNYYFGKKWAITFNYITHWTINTPEMQKSAVVNR